MESASHSSSPHSWNLSVEEARQLQSRLASEVHIADAIPLEQIHTVAGIDVSLRTGGRAAVAVLRFPDLTVAETAIAEQQLTFPYVPGLLSFRETPVILSALEKLENVPDVLLVDGQGLAHPRRFGIACHLGVLTGIPSVGVGKSVLCGKHAPVGSEPGSEEPLVHRGETIGVAYRSKSRANPLIVSVGHRFSLETALALVKACLRGYRLPEPTRRAHLLAGSTESSR